MMLTAAWLSIVLSFGMALLQLSLVFGAPLGGYILGGKNKVIPVKMRFVSGFFACFFAVVGLSYLQRAKIIPLIFNSVFVNVLLIIYTAFLAYAIIGNGFLTKSKKEKYVMTPLSVIGCASSIFLLFNT